MRVECADYDGPWPEAGRPAEAAEAAEAADTQRRPSPVERPLQTALGGSFYLLSGVRTRFGHHIGRCCQRSDLKKKKKKERKKPKKNVLFFFVWWIRSSRGVENGRLSGGHQRRVVQR